MPGAEAVSVSAPGGGSGDACATPSAPVVAVAVPSATVAPPTATPRPWSS